MKTIAVPLAYAVEAPPPGRLEPEKLGILLFICAELMFFAGLLSAFVMFKFSPLPWPPAGQPRLPLEATAVNSLILLLSGFTFDRAFKALKSGGYAAFLGGLEKTFWLGLLFLTIQGTEWVRLVHLGLTLSSGIYGGFFFLLVGIHGLHVAGGLLALGRVRHNAYRAAYVGGRTLGAELCLMYWFFVVGLWPVIFVLVYL